MLVKQDVPVGIVTAIWGSIRYKHCRVIGEYSHAGGVPRRHRRDAALAAVDFVHALEEHWLERERAGTDFVCTVGQLYTDATHHTITKIPGDVRVTMDIRSDDNAVLLATHDHLTGLAHRIAAARNVEIALGPYTNALPARLDGALQDMLREQAARHRIPTFELASGAGHDCAVFANQGVPCAMIFVRNQHGSHNANEAMAIADFGEALRLLVALLEALG
jgi:N-carbamoyl-L-amino-acid hydrolase